MIRDVLTGLSVLTISACQPDETLTRYDTSTTGRFAVQSIDGVPFTARATLDVSTPGELSGQGPCNNYIASQSVPYPWFEAGPIAATRRACPDLDAESAYFSALAAMQFAEFLGDTLLLTNEAGREIVFQAIP